ncbi:MAG: sigma-54-dependent Fis family transcriptional regulator, partial [Verrucomicrobia bacterium]|nr:sigma-54-dependent Fis family transcriptional regulator [Verrucomicrobiota bacterium]
LRKFAREQASPTTAIHPNAVVALERYQWPGNVRELENVIRRALVIGKAGTIMLADLPSEVTSERPALLTADGPTAATVPDELAAGDIPALARALFAWARSRQQLKVLPAVERELVICALAETGGNQVQAAKLLGITRATLRKRIEKFGILRELSIR